MTEVNLALVGIGDIATTAHLPALRRQSRAKLVAVVDPDPARLAAVPDVPGYADLVELPSDVDGVILATPPWVTTGLIVRAAEAGKYVLAEKPVATSVTAAMPLVELSDELAARVQVGLTYRHDPAMELLRSWISTDRLGNPLLVRAHIYDERRDPTDPAHEERLTATLAHGTPVLHEGAHVFDWLSYLLGGPPEELADAWSVRTSPKLPADNLIGARLRYPDSAMAVVEFGWLTEALPPCELSVLGDRAHAVLDLRTFDLRLDTGDALDTVDFPGDRVERCFDRQLDRFIDLITGAGGPSPNLADGIAALETSERVARKAEQCPA
jgi:myo-inositol 2-dehydrogenase/D-chiro-inositol 1-dehydrogenase